MQDGQVLAGVAGRGDEVGLEAGGQDPGEASTSDGGGPGGGSGSTSARLVCGRCAVSRGELAAAGVTNAYGMQEAHAAEPWDATDSHGLEARLVDLGFRLARTWSR